MSLTVITGGTRSGKSRHAEALAAAAGLPVRYVATADGADASMAERIAGHAARRPAGWTTVQAGAALADAIADAGGTCVLLDGLGPWIATQLHRAGAFDDAGAIADVAVTVLAEVDRAIRALGGAAGAIVVAEQAGSGVGPPDAASRAWVDLLGEATQRFTAVAERVELVVAGRAVRLAGGAPAATVRDVPRFVAVNDPLRRHGDRDVRPGDADHAVNVVAGGPPAWLRAVLDAALDADAARYPREDDAVAALAALHGRDPREIVPANGGGEALWLLGPALRPTLAACVHPAFTESEAALHAHGVPVVRVQRDPAGDFALDPRRVPEAADLVIVGNPASPSGTLDPASAVLALRRPGRTVVVDEAFMDLVPGEPGSLVREALPDVIVVRSLTKSLSIPGLRAGYAVAPVALADRLRAVRPPWSVNALALAALAAAAAHPGDLVSIARRAAAEREDLHARLRAIDGVRVWPGAANFLLVEVADGPRVVASLREQAIAVRPAASFPGLDDRHIRITARDPRQNERLAASLADAVAGVPA
jgi:histidinol-phosphate/aromatic aminotransferase/cobyric acid decarboxylase-like protein/adenosyl cobinamide kinase/adenosyl cobinamide phosphate guanylyltransferase